MIRVFRAPARLLTGVAAAALLALAFLTGGRGDAQILLPETVVADLGGAAVTAPGLAAALRAQRAAPDDPALSVEAAAMLIDTGRNTGNARLVGAALAVLQPHVAARRPEAQFLAAKARQYQHDFPGALALLDAVLAVRPDDVNALLNRATVHTVKGDLAIAQQDCGRIAALRPDVGFLCQATTLTMTADAPRVAQTLLEILQQPGRVDPALLPWARSLLAEIALLQGDTAQAIILFEQVLADDPGAQRDQLMLADLLLETGQAARALTVLQAAPETDGVLIRRVLAWRATGQADGQDAQAAAETLAMRAQRSLDIGLVAHAREEGLYYLLIAKNASAALERAQANWALQHEFDDLRLLVRAAVAAGDPTAANAALDWMAQQRIVIPALDISALAAARGQMVKP
ncbi:MAG: tetratricopeptide repeat protein [Rhodobacteraceae bacterium]|nr:tetratricopeptide repeat protein [Paracoccaceae bacterium]